jgi:hypothetical protein
MSESTLSGPVDYGLDAPSVMWGLMAAGAFLFVLGLSRLIPDPGFSVW